jgi:hypothetical protein
MCVVSIFGPVPFASRVLRNRFSGGVASKLCQTFSDAVGKGRNVRVDFFVQGSGIRLKFQPPPPTVAFVQKPFSVCVGLYEANNQLAPTYVTGKLVCPSPAVGGELHSDFCVDAVVCSGTDGHVPSI